MKINKKSVIFIILTVFIIFITPIYSKASTLYIASDNPIENPGYYDPGNPNAGDVTKVTNKVGPIFNIITTIGIVVAVIVIIIIGIKYMIGSVDEKAEYKKTMLPYLIGAIMLVSITTIVKLFAGIVSNIVTTV